MNAQFRHFESNKIKLWAILINKEKIGCDAIKMKRKKIIPMKQNRENESDIEWATRANKSKTVFCQCHKRPISQSNKCLVLVWISTWNASYFNNILYSWFRPRDINEILLLRFFCYLILQRSLLNDNNSEPKHKLVRLFFRA